MAQKFGNGRWVCEGFLDNREQGIVVGRAVFAAVGSVDFYLVGNCRGEIAGKLIRFCNSRYQDEDLAAQVLVDFESPQIGDVSLISFDPHPNLVPHPYIEWFSLNKQHYRIELAPEDASIVPDDEIGVYDVISREIRGRLSSLYAVRPSNTESDWI